MNVIGVEGNAALENLIFIDPNDGKEKKWAELYGDKDTKKEVGMMIFTK